MLYVLLPGQTHTLSLESKAYQQKPINPLFHSFFFEIDCQLNTFPPANNQRFPKKKKKKKHFLFMFASVLPQKIY